MAADAPDLGPHGAAEPLHARLLFGAIVALIAVGFFLFTQRYWVPAHGGVDQNGYLLGAKNLLRTGSMVATPDDAFGFVGRMWVMGKADGTYYPKYPIGLPAIYALALAAGGVRAAYLVNPVAMALALVATYQLVRRVAPSFYATLATLVVLTSPVTIGLTNNPNSHATALCAVAWGMLLLLAWWQGPKDGRAAWARAIGAGFLLGVAVTIRYTEGLLLLPIGLVACFALWDAWRASRPVRSEDDGAITSEAIVTEPTPSPWPSMRVPVYQCVALGIAWAVPVVVLLAVNKTYFGTWTGYDPTNESTGFSWANLKSNWDTMLRQLHNTGLMFVFPVAVVGLALLFRQHARRATVVCAWALPCVLLYTCYYWAPDGVNIGYSRFFLTAFPALAMATAVALRRVDGRGVSGRSLLRSGAGAAGVGLAVGAMLGGATRDGWGWLPGGAVGLLAGGVLGVVLPVRPSAVLVAIGSAAALFASVANLENDYRGQLAMLRAGEQMVAHVPPGAVVFSKDNVMHHAQLVGDWRFYPIDLFNENAVRQLGVQSDDLDKPQPLQPQRAKFLHDLLKDDRNPQLAKRQNDLTDKALAAGHQVFVVVPRREYDGGKARFFPVKLYATTTVASWDDPPTVPNARAARWQPFARPGNANRQPERQTSWVIVEVTKKPAPATVPTTRPSSTQAAR